MKKVLNCISQGLFSVQYLQLFDCCQLILGYSFLLLGGSRIDHALDFGYAVGRETALLGVLKYHLLVGGDVDAVDLVDSDIALHPLNLRPKHLKNRAGFLRDRLHVCSADLPCSW